MMTRQAEHHQAVAIFREALDQPAADESATAQNDDLHLAHGLGTLLMQKIIAYGRNRGLGEIFGDVLAENETMLDLCRRLGFAVAPMAVDGVLRVTLALRGGGESR